MLRSIKHTSFVAKEVFFPGVCFHILFLEPPWALSPIVISGCGELTCLFSEGQQKVHFPAGGANSHLPGWNTANSKGGIYHFI